MCMYTCVSVPPMCRCQWRPDRNIQSPGARVMGIVSDSLVVETERLFSEEQWVPYQLSHLSSPFTVFSVTCIVPNTLYLCVHLICTQILLDKYSYSRSQWGWGQEGWLVPELQNCGVSLIYYSVCKYLYSCSHEHKIISRWRIISNTV